MIQDKPISLSADEISEAKQKKGKLRKVVVVLKDDKELEYIICHPNRKDRYAVIQTAQDGKLEKANELLLNACLLSGDIDAIRKDDSVLEAVLEQINAFQEDEKKVKTTSSQAL